MADFKNRRRYENLNRLSIEQLEELLRTAPFLSTARKLPNTMTRLRR